MTTPTLPTLYERRKIAWLNALATRLRPVRRVVGAQITNFYHVRLPFDLRPGF